MINLIYEKHRKWTNESSEIGTFYRRQGRIASKSVPQNPLALEEESIAMQIVEFEPHSYKSAGQHRFRRS